VHVYGGPSAKPVIKQPMNITHQWKEQNQNAQIGGLFDHPYYVSHSVIDNKFGNQGESGNAAVQLGGKNLRAGKWSLGDQKIED
jgi:hypothetical protein